MYDNKFLSKLFINIPGFESSAILRMKREAFGRTRPLPILEK